MNYTLIQEAIRLVSDFESAQKTASHYNLDVDGFRNWISDGLLADRKTEPNWAGITQGRSPESVISTLLVHMNRYARNYSRSAIYGSDFSTQEDYIYLINLKAFGAMSKMALIKKNIQEKPVGMQIINRLISNGWVIQEDSQTDKRSKVVSITAAGKAVLQSQMKKIRQATQVVSADLTPVEKLELIRLLQKLEAFHQPLYQRNLSAETLLENAHQELHSATATQTHI